jgi:AbiJ N-terminal domain 5/Abortive infection C-terminus
MERRQQILVLARAIELTFSTSEWTEVGYLTGTDQYINSHPRLLRNWGDNDYKGHVLDAVAKIIDADVGNLKRLVEYEPLANWLSTNDEGALHSLQSELYGLTVPDVTPTGSEAALMALADAQTLLELRGPTSAVDRVHTGFHGFLKSACSSAGLTFAADATANQLLKLLLKSHPSLQDLGPRVDEVRRIVQSSASIIDSMGTLRNWASLAHPNEELLGNDEALLVINLGRSLLRFLDSKFKKAKPSTPSKPNGDIPF